MIYIEKECTLCPRHCHANRSTGQGLCGGGNKIKLARAMAHMWEEPCISGTRGSGTIFFSGCQLGCVFCQNKDISLGNFGAEITPERFCEICFELKDEGVHNISLVSADQYVPYFAYKLRQIKAELSLPIVYNCSGYESAEILSMLDGVVDIYLPDLKFFSPEVSSRYAHAPDYFEVAMSAIREMVRQTGKPQKEDGILMKGTLVRHLILPGHRQDSIEIVRALGENFTPDEIELSLMSQYTPNGAEGAPARSLTTFEYQSVLDEARKYGFVGYAQERSSAAKEYTPDFSLQGVIKR